MGNQSAKETVNISNNNSKDLNKVEKEDKQNNIIATVQLIVIVSTISLVGIVYLYKKCKNRVKINLRKEATAELSEIIAADLRKITHNQDK